MLFSKGKERISYKAQAHTKFYRVFLIITEMLSLYYFLSMWWYRPIEPTEENSGVNTFGCNSGHDSLLEMAK
jgi:hypothetical protein